MREPEISDVVVVISIDDIDCITEETFTCNYSSFSSGDSRHSDGHCGPIVHLRPDDVSIELWLSTLQSIVDNGNRIECQGLMSADVYVDKNNCIQTGLVLRQIKIGNDLWTHVAHYYPPPNGF